MSSAEVATFDSFLKRAKNGEGHTYQLHRKMGGVFLDAAFYEKNELIQHRLHLPEPVSVGQELKWDGHNLPYELESYRIGDKVVQVKLYRPVSERVAFAHFCEDVAEAVLDGEGPQSIVDNVQQIKQVIEEISRQMECSRTAHGLDDEQLRAVDTFFGSSDIWNSAKHLDEDLNLVVGEYIQKLIHSQTPVYKKLYTEEIERRAEIFRDIEEQIIYGYECRLKQQGFKAGFVRK